MYRTVLILANNAGTHPDDNLPLSVYIIQSAPQPMRDIFCIPCSKIALFSYLPIAIFWQFGKFAHFDIELLLHIFKIHKH